MAKNPLSSQSYTNKDFNAIFVELLDLVKELTYKWDPSISNESDPGVILLKLNALIADKNNYNIDKNILEAFPETVTQEVNARNMYKQLAYHMPWYQTAKTDILLKWTGEQIAADSEVRIPQYTMITDSEGSVVYTLTEDVVFTHNHTEDTASALQGVVVKQKVTNSELITLDVLDSNNRLYLDDYLVAENAIFIKDAANKYTWELKNNLAIESQQKPYYEFGVDSRNNICYIQFTEGIASLIGRGLYVTYLVTQGSEGNVAARTLDRFYEETSIEVNGESVTLNSDIVQFYNASASTGGLDPQSIEDAYKAYKRTAGTFDTLVTLRDYINAIYNSGYVSNVVVCDRLNDIQSSYSVVTDDDTSGVAIYNLVEDTGEFISYARCNSNHFEYSEDEDGITICSLKFDSPDRVYFEYSDDESAMMPITDRAFKVTNERNIYYLYSQEKSRDLNAFDLRMYLLSYPDNGVVSTANYEQTFDLIPPQSSVTQKVQGYLESQKCIQHDFKDIIPDVPCLFTNSFPLKIKIVPQYKLEEQDILSVKKSIITALYDVCNSRAIEFGAEPNYDVIYDTIQNADERIKVVILDDFIYTTFATYWDSSDKVFKRIPINDDDKNVVKHFHTIEELKNQLEELKNTNKDLLNSTYFICDTDECASNLEIVRGTICIYNSEYDKSSNVEIYKVYSDSYHPIRKEILLKSILAGKTSLYKELDDLKVGLDEYYMDNVPATRVSTHLLLSPFGKNFNNNYVSADIDTDGDGISGPQSVKIPIGEFDGESTTANYTLGANESLRLLGPSFNTTKTYSNYVKFELVTESDSNALSLAKIYSDSDYTGEVIITADDYRKLCLLGWKDLVNSDLDIEKPGNKLQLGSTVDFGSGTVEIENFETAIADNEFAEKGLFSDYFLLFHDKQYKFIRDSETSPLATCVIDERVATSVPVKVTCWRHSGTEVVSYGVIVDGTQIQGATITVTELEENANKQTTYVKSLKVTIPAYDKDKGNGHLCFPDETVIEFKQKNRYDKASYGTPTTFVSQFSKNVKASTTAGSFLVARYNNEENKFTYLSTGEGVVSVTGTDSYELSDNVNTGTTFNITRAEAVSAYVFTLDTEKYILDITYAESIDNTTTLTGVASEWLMRIAPYKSESDLAENETLSTYISTAGSLYPFQKIDPTVGISYVCLYLTAGKYYLRFRDFDYQYWLKETSASVNAITEITGPTTYTDITRISQVLRWVIDAPVSGYYTFELDVQDVAVPSITTYYPHYYQIKCDIESQDAQCLDILPYINNESDVNLLTSTSTYASEVIECVGSLTNAKDITSLAFKFLTRGINNKGSSPVLIDNIFISVDGSPNLCKCSTFEGVDNGLDWSAYNSVDESEEPLYYKSVLTDSSVAEYSMWQEGTIDFYTDKREFSIAPDTEYQLRENDTLTVFYREEDSEDAPYRYFKYSGIPQSEITVLNQPPIIKPSFMLYATALEDASVNPHDLAEEGYIKLGERYYENISNFYDDNDLSGTKRIEIREMNQVLLNGVDGKPSKKYYFVTNSIRKTTGSGYDYVMPFHRVSQNDNITVYRYTLDTNEHFIYTNNEGTEFEMLHAGSQITIEREGRDLEPVMYKYNPGISYTTISNEGAVAFLKYCIDVAEDETIVCKEQQLYNLIEGDTIYLTMNDSYIAQDFMPITDAANSITVPKPVFASYAETPIKGFTITYKLASANTTSEDSTDLVTIPSVDVIDSNAYWTGRACLNVVCSPTSPQKVTPLNNTERLQSSQIFIVHSGEDKVYDAACLLDDCTDFYVRPSVSLQTVGGKHIDISNIDITTGNTSEVSFYLYQKPVLSVPFEQRQDGTFCVNCYDLVMGASGALNVKLNPASDYIFSVKNVTSKTIPLYVNVQKAASSVKFEPLTSSYSQDITYYYLRTDTSGTVTLSFTMPEYIPEDDVTDADYWIINAARAFTQNSATSEYYPDFQSLCVDLSMYDYKGCFKYDYTPDSSLNIEDPLVSSSFFDANHIRNPFTIAKAELNLSATTSTIGVVNNR